MTVTRTLLVKLDKYAGGQLQLSYSEPIGICYIAAYLQQHGMDCRLCHILLAAAEEQLCAAIEDYKPDIVGFSVRNFNLAQTRTCLDTVRRRFPKVRIAVGGEIVTEELFERLGQLLDADIFMIGDGETSLLNYVAGTKPSAIPGVAFKIGDRQYRSTGIPAHSVSPDRLPMMSRARLPMERYCSPAFPNKRYATIHAQRGCRYRCTFCHTAGRYPEPLSRQADKVLAEVDHLVSEYGVEAIAVWDEDFFSDPARVQAFAEGLVARGTPVQWHSYMKLTDLRRSNIQQLLPLLRRSGYVRAVIGLESFLPATLRSYHKANGADAENLCKHLAENNIFLCPTYIIGAPHESREDVRYGLQRLLRLRDHGILVDLPYITFITPFPGTQLYYEYARNGLIVDDDWSRYDGDHVVIRSKCPSDQLVELRDSFYDEFYGS